MDRKRKLQIDRAIAQLAMLQDREWSYAFEQVVRIGVDRDYLFVFDDTIGNCLRPSRISGDGESTTIHIES